MTFATNFKEPAVSTKTRRRRKAAQLKRQENDHKDEVRLRDCRCRFPLCVCARFDLFLEVSHQEHKGMGGDPTGERSTADKMLYICNWRHKESPFSIDKKTIRWEGLTDAGANGPIRWLIDIGKFSGGTIQAGTWIELARELAPGTLAPLTVNQAEILKALNSALIRRFR